MNQPILYWWTEDGMSETHMGNYVRLEDYRLLEKELEIQDAANEILTRQLSEAKA